MSFCRRPAIRPAAASGAPAGAPASTHQPPGFRFLLALLALLVLPACERGATENFITGRSEAPSPASGRPQMASPPSPDRPSGRDANGGAPENSPFRFAVKGDWGAATPAQAAVTAQICARRAATEFNDVLTTGDNFYRPDGVATQANYYRPESCLTAHRGHRWRAVWGNHDVAGDSTRTVLGADRYYTWSAGPVQFYMLDSNRPDAVQTAWLDSELAASGAPVKIAVFHHPPFTSGTHESDLRVRESWVPIFERHRVSLVLSGHNHLYEHLEVNGIHYLVTGGGGANLYRCSRREPWLRKCEARHHFLSLTVGPSATEVIAVDSSGATLDRFEIRHPE